MDKRYPKLNKAPLRVAELVTADGLQVGIFDETGADDFIESFRKAWQRIPLADRTALLNYWKAQPRESGEEIVPAIVLNQGWNALGLNHREGAGILYNAPGLHHARLRQNEELAQTIIAHELAHTLQWAEGTTLGGTKDGMIVEDEADEIVKLRWGFSGDYRQYVIDQTHII